LGELEGAFKIFNMIRTKQIIRNWRRNKLFSLTAIISLTIGFACCNLLAAFVINEWQISNGSTDNERIFVLKTDNPMTLESTKEKSSYILHQVPPLLMERYPEVESFCRFQPLRDNAIFKVGDFKTNKLQFLRTDKNITDFLKIPVIAGNLQKTLSTPGETAITTSWANKSFGTTDVLGKTIILKEGNKQSTQKITAIVDNSYTSSFVIFDVLLPLKEENFNGGVTFLKLRDGENMLSLQKKMDNDIKDLPKFTKDCKYYLQSLREYYFDKSETQTNWSFLLKRDSMFITVGIFAALAILFVSCFNFINLYLVRLFKSGKTNSIQLLLGASSWQLQKHMILESFIATLIGFFTSVLLVLLALPSFNHLFGAHLSAAFLLQPSVIVFYLVLIATLTLIPAIYLGFKFRKSGLSNLKNIITGNTKAVFSNTMMSIQFGFSVLLIIAALVYSQQLNFISETANINPNIVEVQGAGIPEVQFNTFKNKVNNLSCVDASTISNTLFLNTWIALGDDNLPTLGYNMDNDFLKVHNIVLSEGSGFTENSKENNDQAIVNETLIKKYKLDSPIGQSIELSGSNIRIVGVVKDFYTEPFSTKVKPTVIKPYIPDDNTFKTIQIKLTDGIQRQAALIELKQLWKESFPDKTFQYSFPADDFKELHKDYSKLAEMINFFTLISFLLTSIGLFAIAWYSVEQRTKEIGIRKVNGAKISEIITMLNKDIVKWVVIAFTIATPIAWYLMNNWLENFAYKTTLSWWIFALAGVLALGIALLTVSWQSWKAATRNPVKALRYE